MKSQYAIPFAIVIVGLLIAGAIFLVSKSPAPTSPNGAQTAAIKPVDPTTDHIMGNPDAPVKIVEYADLACPYCQQFEPTMDQLMQYYGPSGKVAWVYRPFPLISIHPNAAKEAAAAECVAQLGGNTAYFKFIDEIYTNTPTAVENEFDMSTLPSLAQQAGVNVNQFNQCYSSDTYDAAIQQDYQNAIAAGFQGTPSIVIVANGSSVLTLSGDQPYASMRAAIDQVLQNIGQSISTSTSSTSTSSSY